MTATVSQPVQTSPVTENVMENGTHKSNNVLASQDVGLIFVREYYTFLNKSPHRLHGFYSEDSFMVRGDEGEVVETICGQEEIRKKIKEMDFQDCRVLVTQVDSQISANNGILVQVLGEMCNRDAPLQKFSQTFFLAPQPNGYYVLNDIFRFLKDEVNIDYYTCEEQDKQQQQHTEEQQPQQETNNVEAKASAAPATPPEVPAHETVELDSTAATAATTPTVGPAVVAEPPVHPSPETPAVEPEKKVDAKAKQEPEPAKDMEENVKPSEQPKQIKTDKKEPAAPKTWSNIAAGTTTSSNKWNNPLSGSSSPTTPTVSENKENIHSQPQLKHQKNNHQQSSQHQTHGNGYNHYNRDTARKENMTEIFLKHVPKTWTPEQIKEVFAAEFGEVKSININAARQVGFLEFATPESCQKALAQHKVNCGEFVVLAEERRPPKFNRQQQNGGAPFERRFQTNSHRRGGGAPRGGGGMKSRGGGNPK